MDRRAMKWLSERLVDLSALLLLAMMIHVCADVFMKYVANRPIQGTLEVVSYYYMVWAVFFPLAFVELTRSAVAVDIFFNMMPKFMKVACMALVLAVCAATYAGLSYITWADALRSFSRNEVVMGPVAVVVWPSRFVLPISFALAGFVCLWHFGRLCLDSRARDDLTGSADLNEGTL